MTEETLRKTPLNALHRRLGARMVPFGGWDMPVQYAGILEESRAVRTGCGLFDISHMGRARLKGPGALPLLQRLTTNDVAALASGQAHYSLLTNPGGGIMDDIIVYRAGADEFWLVINAGNSRKDLDWLQKHAGPDADREDWTERTAMIAAQGPRAPELVDALTSADLLSLKRFSFSQGTICGVNAIFCRTGYTGEDGFEIIVPAEAGETLWVNLQKAGGVPCGLGARDALRIEAGYPLYGHEIDETTSPVEAGLMWVVKPDKGDFIGRDEILAVKRRGAARRLVGILLAERIVPRQGYSLYAGEQKVGVVTSGVFSPSRGHGLGMAYVDDPHHASGTVLDVVIRDRRYPVTVVPKKDLLFAQT